MSQLDEREERLWSTLCHVAGLIGFIFPFGFVLGPILVWLIKKDDSAKVDRQGRKAINFQISMTIYIVIAAFVWLLGLKHRTSIFPTIALYLMPALAIILMVLAVVAAIKVNNGGEFKYPLSIRFLKEN